MNRFMKFAVNRPIIFGLVLIFIYAMLGTLTYPVHFLFPESEVGQLYGDALSKFIIFLCFLFILWCFGWIKASGINRLGNFHTWIIVIIILIYKIPFELFAFTGDFSVKFPNSPLAVANLIFSLQTGLVEETIFRALMFVAMIKAWGESKNGQIKAAVLSSLYFGVMHMVNILIRPLGVVLFQAIIVSLPGILYAALVLSRKSLWPAIALHWLTNAAVNIKLIGNDAFQETLSMWIIYAIILIPIVVYSAFLIWKLPESYRYEMDEEAG
jgi:membrane protease YdiL (CAAX protease family)